MHEELGLAVSELGFPHPVSKGQLVAHRAQSTLAQNSPTEAGAAAAGAGCAGVGGFARGGVRLVAEGLELAPQVGHALAEVHLREAKQTGQ